MWILFIAAILIAHVCLGLALQKGKLNSTEGEYGNGARIVLTVSICVGVLLFTIASFGIETYVDVWDYGKLTEEGFLYIAMKLSGATIIAENMVALIALAVKELKDAATASIHRE